MLSAVASQDLFGNQCGNRTICLLGGAPGMIIAGLAVLIAVLVSISRYRNR